MAVAVGIISTAISILSIAYTVGSMIFGPRGHTTNVEGSRLGDLSVTASTYGVVQPIAFGTVRVAGNLIWGTPIKETKSSQVHRAGKSSKHAPSTRQITYSYSSTFALALTRGIASGVVRIWANSTLVYDATGGSNTVNAVGFNFRFYPGDGNQLPDSLIEADKGVGNVPGHRGLCYLVFDDIPLLNYGNRIPNLSVELSFGAAIDQATQALSPAHAGTLGDIQPGAIAFNPLTLRAYVATKAPAGIVEFDLTTMQVLSEHKMSAMFSEPSWDTAFLGQFYQTMWIGSDQRLNILTGSYVYSVDGNTFTSPVKLAVGTGFDTALLGSPLVVLGPQGLESYTIVSGGNLSDVRIVELGAKLISTGTITAYAPSIPFDMSGITYACSFDGKFLPNAYIQAISVEVHPDVILGVLAYTRIAKIAIVATLQATTFDATATGFYNIGCFLFNSLDYTVIAMFTTWNGGGVTGFEIGTSWLAKINPGNSQIIWKTQFIGAANVLTMFNSDIRSDRLAFMGGNVVYTYDTSNGALISAVNWAGFTGVYANTQLYTGIGNCLIIPTLDGLSWTLPFVEFRAN